MRKQPLIWIATLVMLSGCATASIQLEQATGDLTAKFAEAKTGFREFMFPGGDAFERGQKYMAAGEPIKAIDAFSEALKRAPDKKEYMQALKAARAEVVRVAVVSADKLPATALVEKIKILETT